MQMSAPFSKVHGVRLRMTGSHLGGKPVKLVYIGGVSPALPCSVHPTGTSKPCICGGS